MLRQTQLMGKACRRTLKSREARIPTLAIVGIIVVVVVVVLAALFAMFYVLSTGVIKVTEAQAQLSEPSAVSGNEWEITVESADPTWDSYNYMAILSRDDSVVATLEPLTGTSAEIAFTDLEGEGDLTPGDYFRVTCEPAGSYSLMIVYRTGMKILDTVEWET